MLNVYSEYVVLGTPKCTFMFKSKILIYYVRYHFLAAGVSGLSSEALNPGYGGSALP
jgi:hypothetical protein